MREFITAVAEEIEAGEEDKGITFKIDDREMVAYRPQDGQVAFLMARIGRHSNSQEKLAGIIDFFVEVLGKSDKDYIVNRLLSRDDPFGFTQVTEIMEFLMEEWGGRPTKSSSASSK